MSFRDTILDAIKTLPQWKDISPPSVERGDFVFRKNAQRCYEINTAIARVLNKNENIETLLVGAHYTNTRECMNYYVLARNRSTGETMIVDAVINSNFEGMREPFIGSLNEAKYLINSNPSMKWKALWDLDNIIVHEPQVPLKERNSLRNRWGEQIGQSLVFDIPQRTVVVNTDAKSSQISFGKNLNIEEMNQYAQRMGLNLNFIGTPSSGWEKS
jgi:hypothetical protein